MNSPGGAERVEPVTYGAVNPVEKKLEPVPQLEGALDGGREPDREFGELVNGTPLDGELVGTSPDDGPVLNGILPVDGNPVEGERLPDLELIESVNGALLG